MTLRYCSRFHLSGIKSIALCRRNQPDVWNELCTRLSIRTSLVVVLAALIHYHLTKRHEIERFCCECEKTWNQELVHEIIPKLESLFDCHFNKEIRCYIGLYPTYIRDINERYFLLPYGVSYTRFCEILIHELSHFYCYESCGDSLSSGKLWLLSEQIVPYLLRYQFGIESKSGCYAGRVSNRRKILYCSWAKGQISFEELLVAIKNNE